LRYDHAPASNVGRRTRGFPIGSLEDMRSILLLCLAPWLFVAGESKTTSDYVELTSGKRMNGRVVFEGNHKVVLETGRGELEYESTDVTLVHSVERSLKEYLERFATLQRQDLVATTDLALWCERNDLPNEAHNLWLRVFLADPQNEAAFKAVGARKAGKKVELHDERRWLDLDEYRGAKEKWRDALHFSTTHFDIETDAPLEKLLDASVAIERHYLRFYAALGQELVLYAFDERPVLRFYAKAKDFPESWRGGDNIWFEPRENVLHVLATEKQDMTQVVRSVTDMLLFNACRRSSGKSGQVPGWVAGAIGESFAATAPPEPFGKFSEFGVPVKAWFLAEASDPEPIELKTLLRSSLAELRRGADAGRRSTAAYTLGHFLVRGDDGVHRKDFFKYLRGAWLGKINTRDLYTAVGMTEDELNTRWRAYINVNAH
jgi:hypothetical protein